MNKVLLLNIAGRRIAAAFMASIGTPVGALVLCALWTQASYANEAAPTAPPLIEPSTDDGPNVLADANGYLIVGAGVRPEYLGSATEASSPFFITRFRTPGVELSLEGLDWYADALASRLWRAGLTTSFELPRDDTVTSSAVARLPSLGLTASPGLFAGFEMPNRLLPEGLASARVAWRHALNGDREGNALAVDVDYFFAATFMWRLGIAANAVFVDDDWVQSRFGVDADASAKSGLETFDAGGGLYSLGASAYTIVSLSRRLGLFGRIAISELQGDAASSPVVDGEGLSTQQFTGIGVFYLFR